MQLTKQATRSYGVNAMALIAAMILTLALSTSAFASAAAEHLLHTFTNSPDGFGPAAGLVADSAGNLYGTTPYGGATGYGCVFELSPPTTSGGAWTESILYSFQRSDSDGQAPYGTLILDQQGNLYGTTAFSLSEQGAGTVFDLSPPTTSGGAWTETILYQFPANNGRGTSPEGKLVMDAQGDLFGTTNLGGSFGFGVVFELRPPSITGSRWRELTLHEFGGAGDGSGVNNNLIMSRGALYGTTSNGGASGNGTVFELQKVSGVWNETILYSFAGTEGANPGAGLMFDALGNLYGTTIAGGASTNCGNHSGCGVVFQLSPPAVSGGPWTETTLYSFTAGKDGAIPSASLVVDKAGNLYGTASQGGLRNSLTNNNGTVFELSPPASSGGAWTETTLHDFGGTPSGDGRHPFGELLLLNGKFYGTTSSEGLGTSAFGTVFSLVVTP
jgi:uncharacterized repeat protein (TIGR03803 family)